MAEYIEREALLKDIEECVIFSVKKRQENTTEMRGVNKVLRCIEDASTADVVEVVRCKDCKYFKNNIYTGEWCNHVDGLLECKENDYCSYGEE